MKATFKSSSALIASFFIAWGCTAAPRDACSLLSPAELQRIQGERPVAMTPSDQVPFRQCFYRLPTFTQSITIGYATEGRELWEHSFEENEESEREAEEHPPRAIAGVGEEAMWSALPIGATLYVLDGDTMVRIGIGGSDRDEVRLEKATTLARLILRRLERHRDEKR